MKNLKKYLLLILITIAFISCQREVASYTADYQVKLSFINMVGNEELKLNTTYSNPHLEPFTVSSFKYYISSISFSDDAGNETKVPESYFLIDEKNAASKSFTVSVTANKFSKLSFYVGVDSSRNVSGVQTGSLDPVNGMFWTWSTGYIMAKLEGTSPVSAAPSNGITYHIGGFKSDENVVKKVSLILPAALNISKEKASEVKLSADVNAWFNGASDVMIADHPYCMNPGVLAGAIAANYRRMFAVKEVVN